MTATAYLPAPIKVENNRTDSKPNPLLWLASTIALGSLAYYAPKTFFVTAVGIFTYQVCSFNQLVQTADKTKHQRIHAWAINACLVMASIGSVFMLKSLPYVWSAFKDVRQFHILPSVGHLAKAVILVLIGTYFDKFNATAKDLASRCRWVEMEDYVENYPAEIKQMVLSSYSIQFIFYISALLPQTRPLPQTRLAEVFSKISVWSQFQPEGYKFSILQNYFNAKKPDMGLWPYAIHQFQQLSVENQIALGLPLSALSQNISEAERNALPDDVKAVILNQTLKGFTRIPTDQEDTDGQWQDFVTAFEKLPQEQQSVLGKELLRLITTVTVESITNVFTEMMRLAALKACILTAQQMRSGQQVWTDTIFDSLTDSSKTAFGLFLQQLVEKRKLKYSELSLKMKEPLLKKYAQAPPPKITEEPFENDSTS